MNKRYCQKLFTEIFTDSASRYRFCCHANTNPKIEGMTVLNTLPFDFFRGPEMEQIRQDVMEDKPIAGCEVCYTQEKNGHKSYRQGYNENNEHPTTVQKIDLKLRIFGTLCNLGCYMCIPFDSSTRRKELQQAGLKDMWHDFEKENWSEDKPVNIGQKRYQELEDDLIANIDYCTKLRFYGGEPLMLPRVKSFLERIPEDKARNIDVLISTNLTQNTQMLHWIRKRFRRLILNVSVDHYGSKLAWIRYPIDVAEFERNLEEFRPYVNELSVAVSMLNVYDLKQIEEHYRLPIDWVAVHNPRTLSIRNIPDKDRVRYIPTKDIEDELFKEANNDSYLQGVEYVNRLEAHRGFVFGGHNHV